MHSPSQENHNSPKAGVTSEDSSSADETTVRKKSLVGVISRKSPRDRHSKNDKIGHRRVNEQGEVTFKKRSTNDIRDAIQLGVYHSISETEKKPDNDLLFHDFGIEETVDFPSKGSSTTLKHRQADFSFRTFAPVAFRAFRRMFHLDVGYYLQSVCSNELRELSNPGASGSIFYITEDDQFIVKTVNREECKFLQQLLPEYFINLHLNTRTLLPRYYGMYCYRSTGKNIRFVIMNNLLPSSVKIHEKYDLKGSWYKRRASEKELAKSCPTLKDLDFDERHPDGIFLEKEAYDALSTLIARDCRVLESFSIMDFSLLLGIHNLDIAKEERHQANKSGQQPQQTKKEDGGDSGNPLERTKSQKRVTNFSTAIETILPDALPVELEEEETTNNYFGGIPARNKKGERLLLYLGIIDILQIYRLRKKIEHGLKTTLVGQKDAISVAPPKMYCQRFQHTLFHKVFHYMPAPMRQGPAKRQNSQGRAQSAARVNLSPATESCSARLNGRTSSTSVGPALSRIRIPGVVSSVRSEQLGGSSPHIRPSALDYWSRPPRGLMDQYESSSEARFTSMTTTTPSQGASRSTSFSSLHSSEAAWANYHNNNNRPATPGGATSFNQPANSDNDSGSDTKSSSSVEERNIVFQLREVKTPDGSMQKSWVKRMVNVETIITRF